MRIIKNHMIIALMRLLTSFCLVIGLVALARGALASEKIVYCRPYEGDDPYLTSVITMALNYAGKRYEINYIDSSCTQARQVEYVLSGRISLMWAGTTPELEEKLQPIRIPLFKGLLGHRILLIRRGDQQRFNDINSLDDLRQVKLGQAQGWSDSEILAAAGMNLVIANTYESLFPMLEGGRFDAFPRGLTEPWSEMERKPELNLALEERIAIVYSMPAYLFVSKENQQLARWLEDGLNRAVEDGSFDQNFYSDPGVKSALDRSNIKNRKIFHLPNPFLSPETPLDRKELWLDLSKIK